MNHLMGTSELPRVAPGLALDVDSIRGDFPVLQQQVHGHPLVYLDNGASAQKPEAVTGTTPNTTYVDVKALAADHLTSARRRA